MGLIELQGVGSRRKCIEVITKNKKKVKITVEGHGDH